MKVDTTTNPASPCSEPYQTHTHILHDCHLYRDHQYILEEISPPIYPPDILSTHKGIKALGSFCSNPMHLPGQEQAHPPSTNPLSMIDCQRTTSMRNSRIATQQQHTTQPNKHILYFFSFQP